MMEGQSKTHSGMESVVNVLVGFGVALLTQILVFPLFDIHIPISHNLGISVVFTVVSLVRSYCLRRAFNYWHLCQRRRA